MAASSAASSDDEENKIEKLTGAFNMEDVNRIFSEKGLRLEKDDHFLPIIEFNVYDKTKTLIGKCKMFLRQEAPKIQYLQIIILSVNAKYRKSGIGTLLIQAAAYEASRLKCLSLDAITVIPTAEKFYTRLGFEENAEGSNDYFLMPMEERTRTTSNMICIHCSTNTLIYH